jgi:hypothetical protein
MGALSVTFAWGDLASLTAGVLGVLALLGAFYRWVLLPNLREELRPMHQVNREISGGPHEPSVRDKLDELASKQDDHAQEIEDAALEMRAMALMFDGHLTWAQEEVDRLRAERQTMVDAIWAELNRQRTAGERPSGRHRGDREP